jgi:hypothetical protein
MYIAKNVLKIIKGYVLKIMIKYPMNTTERCGSIVVIKYRMVKFSALNFSLIILIFSRFTKSYLYDNV